MIDKTTSNGNVPLTRSALTVVGVGASAGGLEALQTMLSNLPIDTDMAFVVAQHLSPSYKSMMVDLLEKACTIPITSAVDNEVLEPNHAYICPPNFNIEITNGDRIRLISYPEARRTPRPSVDMLFESIASIKGENAIGIVLSGTGTDGSRGIRAIKGENGFGIVQDPKDAKYDGMPNSAINSGNVDIIVQSTEIGSELKNILHFPRRRSVDNENSISRETYNGIINILKKQCKVDFTLYKENTIVRRIDRRMTTLRLHDTDLYLEHLKKHAEEVSLLFNDMLIGVTSFFRDARAFDRLDRELSNYIQNRDSKELRIWCVGCSTGEEPYSIAIILNQILGEKIDEYKIQIFATDIDKNAIEFARNAVYPESALQNLPKGIREKFFIVNDEQFEVKKSIKSHVIFSVHDINNDPPFLRLDLITCRNLMIYFTVELQRQILPTFHYALNPKGILMLGQSESIGVFQEQYRPLSKTSKIYEALFVGKQLPPERKTNNIRKKAVDYEAQAIPESPRRTKLNEEFSNIIALTLKQFVLPNAILVNENQDIIFTEGENKLLVRPSGLPTNNIFKNLHPQLSIDLRSAFHQLHNGRKVADTGFQSFSLDGKDVWVKLILISIQREGPLGSLTLLFSQIEEPVNIPVLSSGDLTNDQTVSNQAVLVEQQRQLFKTKEQLQNVIEELETSNEEMQSMNEELQSSNEELQSSNEELETTNEELQSTNEELQTAYAELRMAYEEREHQRTELEDLRNNLQHTNSLLEDAETSAKMGSWLWDISTRKIDWSNGCYTLFGLDPNIFHPSYEAFIGLAQDHYRGLLEGQLTNLLHNKANQPFIFEAYDVNKNTVIISLEAVVSFNDLKQAVKVMGTMTDVTEKVISEREHSLYKDKINYILNSSLNAACVIDLKSMSVEYVNAEFYKLLGYSLDSLQRFTGDAFYKLFEEKDQETFKEVVRSVIDSKPGQAVPSSYQIVSANDASIVPVYANHTIYEVDENTLGASKMLVTLFSSKS
ncbi:CheR family methyltransferase [Marinomonas arenicola]|uniref:CheR family methyltransferase n=1 Tax=Marinomonas arenicola TaxID=569601 RepID=UPI00311DF701